MLKEKLNEYKKRKWKGFPRYLYKIVLSNIFLILIPICILGVIWYTMISHQAAQKFHQEKSITLNEIASGINQRVKTIKLEVATESREQKYSTYTYSGDYTGDLSMIVKRLYSMTEKYHLIFSVYFYDKLTGKIYNSKSGKYNFEEFYDTTWMRDVNEEIYSVQQLPLRYAFDNEKLLKKFNTLYSEFNQLVFTYIIKGKPDFYLAANISIDRLYNEIADSYNLYNDNQEFFFLDESGQLIDGKCSYTASENLLRLSSDVMKNGVAYIMQNNRIYFMKSLDFGIYCVTSYPLHNSYQEAQYLGKYIFLICIGLTLFLLVISVYMAKRLYQPINTLYIEIADNSNSLHKENIYDDIDMLKQVFLELNNFNSNARLNLKQFDEISKTFRFRNFLENYQCQKDFLQDHPFLFDEKGNGFCEMLILKIDITNKAMSVDEEMLFRLNLQEVLRTYLQSSMKGILTQIEEDNLVLLYVGNERESVEQTRKVITDTVIKLTDQNVYFAISHPIKKVEEIIPQFHNCLDLIVNSYFFNWKNEIITDERVVKFNDSGEIYNKLLNMNTSFIRSIVSQNESEVDTMFQQLQTILNSIQNVSQVKEVCSRVMVDLDHELHFGKLLEVNLIQAINDNKTLIEMMQFIKKTLNLISFQYKNSDAKEKNYCELAKKYLDEYYMRDMNITDVADHLDISYSYLSKIFRTRTGVTLTDYLNNVRINKSKEYLTNTFLTLGEISEKVGYNNAQSYQRFFKKYINITPGDYRKLYNKP
ncbi:helix-turn-helix domain-containing protein [Anaerocolumna sp. MB42-C2]|uniref:helix-turn-helix domain-containing protein n=1 Tax=Anaerocolumna sp. MB42-C2 TaxID=3070997 RepID=UPI0027E015D3|nr:response regulator transcription factor [Anaerocolumna sp. MB42-C2]WMJ86587.1 helix-turn-helix transcriptional regulator [Anaerocolumna sp. MB42-C2]